MSYNRSNNVMGTTGRRCNDYDVLSETGRRCNRNDVLGETGRRRDRDSVRGIQRIALRGPGCISGTGRCGNFTASFVESNGEFAEGYGNVRRDSDDDICGQVSPAGNAQFNRRRRRRNDCECNLEYIYYLLRQLLETKSNCPR